MEHLTEADLEKAIEDVQRGDTEAYAAIVGRFQKSIFLYGLYLLRDRQEAEDAAQEILIKAFRCIHQFRGPGSFSSWLYKIAYHHCLDLLKKRNRRGHMLKLYMGQRTQPEPVVYEDAVYELLDVLNAQEKQLLLLRALEEYSYEEIGHILDMKPATARKKYERVRKKLIQKKEGNPHAKSITLG
ncbi:hypothetical protein B9G55_12870 [Saccharibacillus sp. O16]|nr:hypothetical protein B9G55_12870 [Saccharibacillus sp. O16]